MKLHIIVIRDIAADCFGQPNVVPSKGSAIRNFQDEINREAPDNILNRHPEHFEMYELGFYDDRTASFELHDKPEQIAVGLNMKVPK